MRTKNTYDVEYRIKDGKYLVSFQIKAYNKMEAKRIVMSNLIRDNHTIGSDIGININRLYKGG